MSDPIDIAADRAELERATAVANHVNRPKPKRHVEQCMECGAAITPMRAEWGAIRCVPCESAHERDLRARR